MTAIHPQISLHFALRPSQFQVTGQWPENDIERLKVKGTVLYNYHSLPNFTPFLSTASHFRVTGYFETSALNDFKITLNTKRSKVPHVHTYCKYPPSLIF